MDEASVARDPGGRSRLPLAAIDVRGIPAAAARAHIGPAKGLMQAKRRLN